MPPLFPMQQVHFKNGPPLPLGCQLYRLLQLQVFPEHALLHFSQHGPRGLLILPHCPGSTQQRSGRLLHGLLHNNFVRTGSNPLRDHNCFLLLPHVPGIQAVHNDWILWKTNRYGKGSSPVALWHERLPKLPGYPGREPSDLDASLL